MINMWFFAWWSFIFLMHHTPIKPIGYVTKVLFWKKKNQLPSMASERSHHLIKLLMFFGVSIQQRLSLQRCHIVGEPNLRIVQKHFFLHPRGIRLDFCILIIGDLQWEICCDHSSTFIYECIFLILAVNKDTHKSLNEFDFQIHSTNSYRVSCPWASTI